MKHLSWLAMAILAFSLAGANPAIADPEYIYDEEGRIVLVTLEDGSVIAYSYDDQGRRITNIDPEGKRREFDQDGKSPES